MKKETAMAIVEAGAELYGDSDLSIYEGYSGRGMYGKTTTGIVVGRGVSITKVVAMATARITEEQEVKKPGITLEEFLGDLDWSSDGMGLDTIYY